MSFLRVWALPKDSRIGLERRRRFFTRSISSTCFVMLAMYLMMIFEASVLPAPLSPSGQRTKINAHLHATKLYKFQKSGP